MQEAGEKATQAAGQAIDSAKSTATERVNLQMEQVAKGVDQVAKAIHRVGGDLEAEQPAIASVAHSAAQQTERLGSYLQRSDVNDLWRTTEDFARRQPLIFFGGAFALGLLASRFLKAGATQQSGSRSWQATGPGEYDYRAGIRSADETGWRSSTPTGG
jgi:hypothetical protein